MRDGCPFCDYDSPVLEDFGDAVVFEPLNPVTPGHVLVVPCEHVEDAAVFPLVTGRMFALASRYARERRNAGDPFAFNLITSAGVVATQTVKHLHVHVVPRRMGDRLLLPWSDTGMLRREWMRKLGYPDDQIEALLGAIAP